jgi:endonuclease/exonuclease/phosphatase family protein
VFAGVLENPFIKFLQTLYADLTQRLKGWFGTGKDMKITPCAKWCVCALAFAGAGLFFRSSALATTGTIRIAEYNINADTTEFEDESPSQGTDLETVLQGIGEDPLNDNGTSNAQPFDLLALEETYNSSGYSGAPTLSSIVSNLNAFYGAGTYAYNTVSDPTTGGEGGGPNALIYNTKTVEIISAAPIGTDSDDGAPRAPMQYLIQPIGYSTSDEFYLDVSHTKSGTDSDDADRRNDEAEELVSNEELLPAGSHVVAVGDYNIDDGSAEQTYQTMIGKFNDLGDPGESWTDTTSSGAKAISGLLSESATDVEYRDDIQFVTSNTLSNSGSPGLQYDQGSYTVFGNGGSEDLYENAVNDLSDNPGVFPSFTTSERDSILDALTGATDHLPTVADYSIVSVPEPSSFSVLLVCGCILMAREVSKAMRRSKRRADAL